MKRPPPLTPAQRAARKEARRDCGTPPRTAPSGRTVTIGGAAPAPDVEQVSAPLDRRCLPERPARARPAGAQEPAAEAESADRQHDCHAAILTGRVNGKHLVGKIRCPGCNELCERPRVGDSWRRVKGGAG